jgi:hypothetical protein
VGDYSVPKPDALLADLKRIRKPSSRFRKKTCPHCEWEWHPNSKRPPKCPHCKRDLNPEARVNVALANQKRRKFPDLLKGNRFAPATMKKLVEAKVYKYLGIPLNLTRLTPGREIQRLANLKLADRYLMGSLSQQKFGRVYKFSDKAAINFRLAKGFRMLAEYARFELTPRGREKIAEQRRRAEIQAARANPA